MKIWLLAHDALADRRRDIVADLGLRLASISVATTALTLLAAFVFQGQPVSVANAQAAPSFSMTATAPFEFTPKSITVPMGTSVRWSAAGAAPHTITSDGCGDPAAGACVFDSGSAANPIRAGSDRSSYEFRFTQPGIYSFYCRFHGAPGGLGEAGKVIVEGTTPAQLAQPVTAAALRPPVSVAVYAPREGQAISGESVTVRLGINGASLREPVAGATDRLFGHYNLLLDLPNADLSGFPIPAVSGVTRSNTNQVTLQSVRPGAHTLTVVWTYDNNVPPQPPIAQTVRFTTAAAPDAAGVRPPSTGDGGLVAPRPSSFKVSISVAALALGASGIFALSRKRA